MVRTQKQLLGSRARELRRKILHTHDAGLRKIYRDHIEFLERRLCNGKQSIS